MLSYFPSQGLLLQVQMFAKQTSRWNIMAITHLAVYTQHSY
jgi:hypothetical protein